MMTKEVEGHQNCRFHDQTPRPGDLVLGHSHISVIFKSYSRLFCIDQTGEGLVKIMNDFDVSIYLCHFDLFIYDGPVDLQI